jgi:hypothetical protein
VEGDGSNDATKVWQELREFMEMGEIVIDRLWKMNEGSGLEQTRIIYDPVSKYMKDIV